MRSELQPGFIRKIAGDSVLYLVTDKNGKTLASKRIKYSEFNGPTTDLDMSKKFKINYNPTGYLAEEALRIAELEKQEDAELEEIDLSAEDEIRAVTNSKQKTDSIDKRIEQNLEIKASKDHAENLKEEIKEEKKELKKAIGRKKNK